MSLVEMQQYRAIRARLQRPKNAIPDEGIDLKRKPVCNVTEIVDEDTVAFGPIVHQKINPMWPTIRNIQKVVASKYGFSVIDLKSSRRPRHLSDARAIAAYLCMRMTKKGSTEIGRAFDKDHTSVLYGHDRITALRGSDGELDADLTEFEAMFASPSQTEDAPCSSSAQITTI